MRVAVTSASNAPDATACSAAAPASSASGLRPEAAVFTPKEEGLAPLPAFFSTAAVAPVELEPEGSSAEEMSNATDHCPYITWGDTEQPMWGEILAQQRSDEAAEDITVLDLSPLARSYLEELLN